MPIHVRGHGNGHRNHRTWNYKFTYNYDPHKLKKYLVERNGVVISVFMFKLKKTDKVLKLLWSADQDE